MRYKINFTKLLNVAALLSIVIAVMISCRNSHPIIVTSDDCNKIVLDIFFNIIQDTDFDESISYPTVGKTSDKEVADKRQYREGYISTLKKLIMEVNVKDYEAIILNKRVERKAKTIRGRGLNSHVTSHFYLLGYERAFMEFELLRQNLLNEAFFLSAKYQESDSARWTSNSNELEKRIKESPHLQAFIFIQQQLQQRPTVEVRVDDNTHQ